MNETVKVRDLAPQDRADWLRLWQGFMGYYGLALAPEVTEFTWERLLSPASPLGCRMAEVGGRVVGFAIYQHHPSTWVMGDDCYLEDMFVAPDARGRGVARAMIEDLIGLARGRGWKRLYWSTELTNEVARRLYDSFTPHDGHVRYRLTR